MVDTLTKGAKKSMAVGKIGKTPARRLDFMYSSPVEFPFATRYFTGNKAFNVVMRQRAVDLGYTMNEHGLYKLVKVAEKKKLQKGKKLIYYFQQNNLYSNFWEWFIKIRLRGMVEKLLN